MKKTNFVIFLSLGSPTSLMLKIHAKIQIRVTQEYFGIISLNFRQTLSA